MRVYDKEANFLLCQDSLKINGVGLGVGAAQFVRCLPQMLEALGSIILNAYKPALWCSSNSSTLGSEGGEQKELKVILYYLAVDFKASLHYTIPSLKSRNERLMVLHSQKLSLKEGHRPVLASKLAKKH